MTTGTKMPTILTLCGSIRFLDTFRRMAQEESLAGKIVLSVECVTISDGDIQHTDPETKAMLDELHLRKIDLSDEILVLNVEHYVGESTRREIMCAKSQGKTIRYLEPDIHQ